MPPREPPSRPHFSVVIPVYNEEGNVEPLADALLRAMRALGRPFEVIFINDGSRDASEARLDAVAALHPEVRVLHFRRNFGQTAAMMAGFDHARGDVIIPMDGDRQNDPADIGALLAKLEEGYDVVSGWRKERKDNALVRNLPSRLANRLISWLSGVPLHDYGCSLKAYRREVLTGFRLYGEMHRFIPIYAKWQGGRIAEIPVRHHARTSGVSKYGLGRIFKVVIDLLLVKFLTEYEVKPIYVFGKAALLFMGIAVLAGAYAVYLKLFEGTSFIQTPLPLLVTLGFITSVMCVLLGFIAEILVRIYFESRGAAHYTIRSRVNFDEPRA